MQIIDIPFLLLRLWVGAYFIYWGLNGFFGWSKVPPNSVKFETFIGKLMKIPVLMTAVKLIEIVAGGLIVSGFQVLAGLVLLTPIVLVIVLSHLILNFARGWRVALLVLLPFSLLIVLSLLR